ncbi:MAG: hypothetical protein HKN29_09785 [Rhodothermales bacterium]|nr:hypothetical protein [Rhodothermales bacterium]
MSIVLRHPGVASVLAIFAMAACQSVSPGAGPTGSLPGSPPAADVSGTEAFVRADTLARFSEASSLSISNDGVLWVADRGAGTVVRLDAGGNRSLAPLQTRQPVAVDATVGLRLIVADESEGSIDVLGREGNLIRRMRVPAEAGSSESDAPQEYLDDRALGAAAGGRPVDLAALPGSGLVALEGFGGFLAFWDESGRLVRTVSEIGGRTLRANRLAASGREVAVLEWEQASVHLFDHLGTIASTIVPMEFPLAVAYDGEELWTADRLAIRRLSASDPIVIPHGAGLGVVDLVVTPDAVYLLTARWLLRLPR